MLKNTKKLAVKATKTALEVQIMHNSFSTCQGHQESILQNAEIDMVKS